jgi:hypothetical protein
MLKVFHFPVVKRPGTEVDHSTALGCEIANDWSYCSNLIIFLHEVRRDNFDLPPLYRWWLKIPAN